MRTWVRFPSPPPLSCTRQAIALGISYECVEEAFLEQRINMNKKINSMVMVFLGFSSFLYAEIIELHSVSDVLSHVPSSEKVLAIFDIDNTLVMTDNECGLGSDGWLSFHAQRISKDHGVSLSEAYNLLLPVYYDINLTKDFSLRPVEWDETLSLLYALQENVDAVIGLTARSYPIVNRTIDLLKNIGIEFNHSSIKTDDTIQHDHGCYASGIGFCGYAKKSFVLDLILKETGYTCDTIIMVDDKVHYLKDVEEMLKKNYPHVRFVGIHYVHLKDFVEKYTPAYLNHQ